METKLEAVNAPEVKRGRKATSEEIEAFSALLRESEVWQGFLDRQCRPKGVFYI